MTKLKIAQENDQRLYKDDSVYVHVKGVVRPFEFFLASIARTIISNTTSVALWRTDLPLRTQHHRHVTTINFCYLCGNKWILPWTWQV